MEPNIELLLEKYGMGIKDSKSGSRSQAHLRPLESKPSFGPFQDKIKQLENYNFEYEAEIQRLRSEISDLKAKNNSFLLQKETNVRGMESDSELKFLTGKAKNLEEQNSFLKNQLDFYEAENRRTQEQHEIDKENWVLQWENLKRQLQYRQIEENSSSQSVKIEKEENKSLRDAITRLRNTEKQLLDENNDLKNRLEKEKFQYKEKIKVAENEIKNLQDDYEISLRETQHENEKLKGICASQNVSIVSLEKKIEELERINKLSEEARDALRQQREATKFFIKDVVSVNQQLADSLKKDSKRSSASKKEEKVFSGKKLKSSSSASNLKVKNDEKGIRKRVSVPSYLNQENKLQGQISELESEIGEINKKYKMLLKNPQEGSFDYPALKAEMDSIAKALDEKSKKLFTAKRRYSSIIREKMMKFEN